MTNRKSKAKGNSTSSIKGSQKSSSSQDSIAPSAADGDASALNPAREMIDVRDKLHAAQHGDESLAGWVRGTLKRAPHMLASAGDVAAMAETAWVQRYAGQDIVCREAIILKAAEIRASLLHPGASGLERILADRVVVCWLQVNFYDNVASKIGSGTFKDAELSLKRQDSAQRRYLRAARTLAEVQRLIRPSVQVNFAQNQTNIAALDVSNHPT